MSIPLVQNNEKDSINTSIIAIKRNIERINMLLGLSNSEEIDTSKFATKEELQQAVTDLQPVDEVAADNMHSVTSNAVAKAMSYSTTEHKTGKKWIDGKDIYECTFLCTGIVTINENWGDITNVFQNLSIIAPNMETLVNGTYHDDATRLRKDIQMIVDYPSAGHFAIYSTIAFYTNTNAFMTLEYTKTTD